jgi:pimeloyl-ACP methyl ester carboxylesterase
VDDKGGSGQPVVFQHGLCGDANQTREAFPRSSILDRRFRRITMECRGHGQSEAGDTKDFSIAIFTDDLVDRIESLHASPVIVGGISMGAAIALRLAVTKPGLVKALILARPAWVATSAPANMAPNALVGRLLSGHTPDEALELFNASNVAKHLAQVAPDNLTSLQSFFQREPHAVTAALLSQISADGPGVTEPEIRALTIPTLVIGTEHDFIHPVAYAKYLAGLIPKASLKVIPAKAASKAQYLAGFHIAITQFLEEHL